MACVPDWFRFAEHSPKTFSFASRNAVSAPQPGLVRKIDWKYNSLTPISLQYCWSARAGKAFSSDGQIIRTDRAAQNGGRKLIGYRRCRYNQAVVFFARCRWSARTLFDGGGKSDV
jgi:hypothetical protein